MWWRERGKGNLLRETVASKFISYFIIEEQTLILYIIHMIMRKTDDEEQPNGNNYVFTFI